MRLFLSLFILFVLLSCDKPEPIGQIDLPSNPILTKDYEYGVIKSAYLRVFAEPTRDSEVETRLRPGYVVKIVSTTAWQERLDNINAPWHKVEYKDVNGWVFGAYVDKYDSIFQAEAASEATR
ncbi:SH3 domain-containing protein [Spirochaeta cellobiosiphila]|uniref:SH3 domain-containing protein n=1 Tax=Spirochaeta cellobiosiphila TaxID=504483 RepID=UPI00040DFEF5|nr:SH3 domain-containing protein [Spirochaeta cellobiosiphila]